MTTAELKLKTRVFGRGLIRAIRGTISAGLIALAGYDLIVVANSTGYAAVALFILGIATVVLAVADIYKLGGGNHG